MSTFNRDLGALTEITGCASAGPTQIANRVATNVFDFTYADINDAAAGYPAGQRGDAPGSGLWPTLVGAGCPWSTADYYVSFSAQYVVPRLSYITEVMVYVTQDYNGAPGPANGVQFACGSVASTMGTPLPSGYDTFMPFTDNELHSITPPLRYVTEGWAALNTNLTLRWNIRVPSGVAGGARLTQGVSQMVATFVKEPLR